MCNLNENNYPILYRKRLIPDECILLKDDVITYIDNEVIITTWRALKPKKDLHHGSSVYFLNKGYKVSKFQREDDSIMYYYCDIIEKSYDEENNTYVFTDLLADVIVYPNGYSKVVDIDEVADALESGLITKEQSITALKNLDALLKIVYADKFDTLTARLPK